MALTVARTLQEHPIAEGVLMPFPQDRRSEFDVETDFHHV